MTSPISYVGSATGTNSATVPANQAGDIAIAFSFRDDGTAAAPSLPSGWTSIASGSGNLQGSRTQYKVLDGTTPSVTFTNASGVIIHVYRASGWTLSIGDSNQKASASGNVQYNALSAMTHTDGTSWAIGFVGHGATDTSVETAPSGMTNRSDNVVSSVCELAAHDTNAGVSSWAQQTVTQGGTSAAYRTSVVELAATQVVINLVGANSSQANTSDAGAVTQNEILVGVACTEAASSSTGAITQVQQMVGAGSAQANASAAGAVTQNEVLTGADCAQANASATGTVTQDEVMVGAGSAQANASASGAITQAQQLVGVACAQAASSGSDAITQTEVEVGAGCTQAATSAAGAITQDQILLGIASAQASTCSAGALTQGQALSGLACDQANSCDAGAILIPSDFYRFVVLGEGVTYAVAGLDPTYAVAGEDPTMNPEPLAA